MLSPCGVEEVHVHGVCRSIASLVPLYRGGKWGTENLTNSHTYMSRQCAKESVSVCVCVSMSACLLHVCLQRPEGSGGFPRLQFQEDTSSHRLVLGTKLGSLEKRQTLLTAEPSLQPCLWKLTTTPLAYLQGLSRDREGHMGWIPRHIASEKLQNHTYSMNVFTFVNVWAARQYTALPQYCLERAGEMA